MIRAVSFFGPGLLEAGVGGGIGLILGINEGAGAVEAPLGDDGLPLNSGGGVTVLVGAGGTGAWAIGGRATVPPGAGGRTGPGRGGSAGAPGPTPFPGGRAGMLIRTVSRADGAEPAAGSVGRGGKVIRTVSFLGSLESAM